MMQTLAAKHAMNQEGWYRVTLFRRPHVRSVSDRAEDRR